MSVMLKVPDEEEYVHKQAAYSVVGIVITQKCE